MQRFWKYFGISFEKHIDRLIWEIKSLLGEEKPDPEHPPIDPAGHKSKFSNKKVIYGFSIVLQSFYW